MGNIRELKERVSLSDWLQYLGVKRMSRNTFLCPFHAEKNPSFSVDPNDRVAKDWHTGESFDHISIAQELKGWSFWEAFKELCRYAGVSYSTIKKPTLEEKIISDGRKYFEKYKDKILERFREIKGYDIPKSLHNQLLFFPKGYKHRQAGRLVFIWYDMDGRPIGFVGRALRKDVKPKYLTTAILPGRRFYKNNFFFSHKAKYSEKIIIAEGIWDALIGQTQSRDVVATGTVVAPKLELFNEFLNLKAVIFIPDPDREGIKAFVKKSWELFWGLKEKNITCFVASLDTDLDEYLMKGNTVQSIMLSAVPVEKYLAEVGEQEVNTVEEAIVTSTAKEVVKKTRACEGDELLSKIHSATVKDIPSCLDSIAKLPLTSQQEFYLRELAKTTNVSIKTLYNDMKKALHSALVPEKLVANDQKFIHPALHIDEELISVGFSTKLCIAGEVKQQDFYILKRGGNFEFIPVPQIERDGKTFVFEPKNLHCVDVERWGKEALISFIGNGKKPEFLKDVYKELKETFKQFIYLKTEEEYSILASYVILTYFHRCFPSVPFLFIYGVKGTGKSNLLSILEQLTFNGVKVKGITLAAVADSLDAHRSTLIIDQAESLGLEKNMELIGFIADSYTRHGGRRRIVDVTSGSRTVREFETYGCKVFASIKPVHYDIKDRCIMITMERSKKPYPTPIFEHPIWREIRGKLYKTLFIYGQEMFKAGQYYKTANRVEELLQPLMILWDFIELPDEEKGKLYKYIKDNIEKNQFVMTDQEKVVFDVILEVFSEMNTNVVHITADKILQDANTRLMAGNKLHNKAEVEGILDKYCLVSDIVVKKNSKGKYVKLVKFEKTVVEDRYKSYFLNLVCETDGIHGENDNSDTVSNTNREEQQNTLSLEDKVMVRTEKFLEKVEKPIPLPVDMFKGELIDLTQ